MFNYNQDNFDEIDIDDLKFANKQAINLKNLEIAYKLTNNKILILKRFLSSPYVVISLLIFMAILATATIAPLVSQYSATNPISQAKGRILSFLNPTWVNGGFTRRGIIDASDPFLRDLINEGIISSNLSQHIYVSANGSMTVLFSPWTYLNNLDQGFHFSILGTDLVGRDIWTRLWTGTRQSLLLACGVVVCTTIIGTTIGAFIGFNAGNKIDMLTMRVIEIINAIPSLIWLVLLVFILPSGFWTLFLAFIIINWANPISITRMYIMRVKDSEYVKAAKSIGVSQSALIFKHALPNIAGKLFPNIIRSITTIIFMESTIAFLGLSPSPDTATLGNIINDAKGYAQYWWYLLSPTIVILLLTVSLQIIGTGLHDAFDPQR